MSEEKLHHVWMEPLESFFKRIEDFGGWPFDKKYVSFFHGTGRECEFGNTELHTEWWTTVCSSDDYYLWKLSEAALFKLRENIKLDIVRKISRRDF